MHDSIIAQFLRIFLLVAAVAGVANLFFGSSTTSAKDRDRGDTN